MRFYGEEPSDEKRSQGFGNDYYGNPQQRYYNNSEYQNNRNGRSSYKQPIMKMPVVWDTSTTAGQMKRIAFLAWFAFSVITMIVLWIIGKTSLGTAVFGQLLAVSGGIAFSKMEKNSDNVIWILVPISGAVIFALGLTMWFGNMSLADSYKLVFPFIILAIFIFIGLFAFVYLPIKRKKHRDLCTIPVDAVLIDFMVTKVRTEKGRTRRSVTPIYEYKYNGKTYVHQGGGYLKSLSVGDSFIGYINPNDPTDFCVK